MGTRGPFQCLEVAMDTFIQRGGTYGEAYKQFGHIMAALFPNGLTLKNPDDWNRYACLHMVVAKCARYANSFEFGHEDSAHDIIVYGAMLESLDIAQRAARLPEEPSSAHSSLECIICGSSNHTTGDHDPTDPEAWVR